MTQMHLSTRPLQVAEVRLSSGAMNHHSRGQIPLIPRSPGSPSKARAKPLMPISPTPPIVTQHSPDVSLSLVSSLMS